MILLRNYPALVVIVVLVTMTLGQTKPEPVLVDDHGSLPCGDSLSRLDYFYAKLHNDPASTGFISIATAPEKRREGAFRRVWIERYTRYRGFDLNRLKILRANTDTEVRVSLWLVPSGAAEPQVQIDDSYELTPKPKKPFMFGSEEFGIVECSEDQLGVFAEFLKANPTARANLVFRDKSPRSARRRATDVVSALTGEFGIARNRIRVFIVRPRPGRPMGDEPIIEFWYLP